MLVSGYSFVAVVTQRFDIRMWELVAEKAHCCDLNL